MDLIPQKAPLSLTFMQAKNLTEASGVEIVSLTLQGPGLTWGSVGWRSTTCSSRASISSRDSPDAANVCVTLFGVLARGRAGICLGGGDGEGEHGVWRDFHRRGLRGGSGRGVTAASERRADGEDGPCSSFFRLPQPTPRSLNTSGRRSRRTSKRASLMIFSSTPEFGSIPSIFSASRTSRDAAKLSVSVVLELLAPPPTALKQPFAMMRASSLRFCDARSRIRV